MVASLAVKQILGLEPIEGADWAGIHGPRYAVVPQRTKIRLAINAFGFLLVFGLCVKAVGLASILGWGIALALATLIAKRFDDQLSDADGRPVPVSEMRRHAMACGLKGAVWAIGLTLAAVSPRPDLAAQVWSVCAILILANVVSAYSVPLNSICFTIAMSVGSLIAAVATFQIPLALTIVSMGIIAVLGALENARSGLLARLSQIKIQEKSETVSMLLREFEEGKADWLWQTDVRRRLCSVSPRFAFAVGKDAADIEGQSFLQLISGDGWKNGEFPRSLHELAERLKSKESFSELIVQGFVEGETRWWELSGTPIIDDNGVFQGYRGVGSDVTKQRESNDKIAYLARYDTLTQLPNRMMLTEALGDALDYAQQWKTRCALLIIDLDRFKAVNDSLGHPVGDRMLGEVAARLSSLMGDGETCGRLGGDEFAVVIRDVSNRKQIETLAKTIIAALSTPYKIDNHILYVGACVGSAIGPRDGTTVETLLRNADLALYRAKDEGGDLYREYNPSLHANAEERRQLEFSLRTALDRNELVLHYQPVVDANDETLVSFEALVRWNSKEHGFVSPGKFIPIAEETRLIVPIGTWVMQEACREAATNWPKGVKVNINVSPEQLLEPDFAATVVRALSHSGLEAHRLEIEVTESIFMRDADVARKALEQCMALGCSVALDDFGTGYSSLGYLRKLKFTTIKVDRLFVQGAAQDSPESLAIIRAVVAMADSLGMTTTAEGVENEEEAAMIRRLGCTKIQGFHFGRPMPVEDVHRLFAQARASRRRRA
ncbi:GGDEF and EAL domain-containing protein [Erythrobacter litoralis]|nr:EAL domain-containing protein [Erythrobacter litoralis]MDG6078725.1 GGDEF and EAL domain-containing protein [Erythrobacter litoralis]